MDNAFRVIFLDIDGVLNSARTATAFGGYPMRLDKQHIEMFDPVALALMRRLVIVFNVKLVLTSSWRVAHSLDNISDALMLKFISKTIRSKTNGIRGEEIQDWIDRHPNTVNYVIVDDDSDMLEHQKSRLVKTDHFEGLSFKDYHKILDILGIKEEW